MEPSSLILVAILGVWAAYLVPHWVRRREDLAAARTPDRFSSRLRVLQRRSRKGRSTHRSGDAVLTSPRVVVDVDGELLYIPGKRPASVTVPAAPPAEIQTKPAPIAKPERDPEHERAGAHPRPSRHRQPGELAGALGSAHHAARRRATILLGLVVVTAGAGVTVPALAAPIWVVTPSAVLLVLHLMASRVAAIRSREHLAVLREQVRPATAVRTRPVSRPVAAPARPAAAERPAAQPDRVARRKIAVGAETWEPVPVPVPTYTLKPVVFRPEPPPLDLPAVASAGGPGSRGSLPRRAEDIERILALDAEPEFGFEHRTAVNG